MRYFRDVVLCKSRLRINASYRSSPRKSCVAIDSRFEIACQY